MFLYGITLATLVEELQAADPVLLTPFYIYDSVFNIMSRHITQMLCILVEWGGGGSQGYFLEPSKSMFISDTPYQ